MVEADDEEDIHIDAANADMCDDGMTCTKHPYKNNPGGICAVCLQEKLGNLVSSALPISASFPSHQSFRSNSQSSCSSLAPSSVAALPTRNLQHSLSTNTHLHHRSNKPRIPFFRKKTTTADARLQRSKSTATPSNRFTDGNGSMQRRSFWALLSGSVKRSSTANNSTKDVNSNPTPHALATSARGTDARASSVMMQGIIIVEEDEEEVRHVANKVSRSRSVGCGGGGSRSFSGDFFERLSNGLGDCTIRRVESQRQSNVSAAEHRGIKERVRCGGIFGGFNLTSASSSSSSSSQWVPPSAEEANANTINGRMSNVGTSGQSQIVHGRNRSWAWALASPLRAFSKPNSNTDTTLNNNAARISSTSSSMLSVSS